MVSFLRAIWLINEVVVLNQVRIPLIGFASQEAIESVKSFCQRPLFAAAARTDVLFRHVVVLAQPECAPSCVLKDLTDGGALFRDPAMRAGETIGTFSNASISSKVVVTSGQQGGACR